MITIAIISRFIDIDIPYMSEWFEYYDNLGITRYYLIDNNENPTNLDILKYYPKNKVIISHVSPSVHSIKKIDHVFSKVNFNISEDYLLHVDSDEFLFLDNLTLQSFLEKYKNYNYFQFNWLMAPSKKAINFSISDILKDTDSPKFFVNQYKSMAKTNIIKFPITNPHAFTVNKKVNLFKKYNIFFIIHFSFRSIYDSYLKLIYNNDSIRYQQDIIDRFLDISVKKIYIDQIPNTALIYMSQITYNKNLATQDQIKKIQLNIKSQTDTDRLEKMIDYRFNRYKEQCEKIEKINLFKTLVFNSALKHELLVFRGYLDKNIFIE